MTPVREALEKPMIVGAVYDTERGPATYHGLDHYIGETTHKFELGNGGSVFIRQQQLDEFLKRAFATPGEPCAWRIRFKNFDEVTTDPAKAERWRKVYPDQKVDPLYTTPQPAAGWDKAAGYAERLTVALWEKHFKNDAPQWKPLSGDLIGLLTQIDNMTTALRREAPAPAEGMAHTPAQFVDDVLSACDASNWDAELNTGDYYRGLRDAYERIHELAGEYQLSMYAWSRPSPPADRREIVARECADEIVRIVEAAERVAKRTGNTFVIDRAKVATMIRGQLAAGRAALAQSEEEK